MADRSQQKMQQQMKERREEQVLFQRFQNVATAKLEHLSRQLQINEQNTTINGSNDDFTVNAITARDDTIKFGEEEKRILSNLTGMGVKEGIAASVASFIILRRGPKYIGRWIQRRNQSQHVASSPLSSSNTRGSTSSYQLSDPTKFTNKTSNNPFYRAGNGSQNDFPRPRGFISRSIWFVFDGILSLMVGANVSMAFTDKDAIRQQIVDLPLVPERSLVADALCDDIVEELRKVRQEKNPTFERLQKVSRGSESTASDSNVASYYLDGIILFCQNCERRRYFERRLREERGLGRTVPVEIPYPGVPIDGPRLVVVDGEEKTFDEGGIEDPFLGDQFDDNTSWANDFVSDRNDDDRDLGM